MPHPHHLPSCGDGCLDSPSLTAAPWKLCSVLLFCAHSSCVHNGIGRGGEKPQEPVPLSPLTPCVMAESTRGLQEILEIYTRRISNHNTHGAQQALVHHAFILVVSSERNKLVNFSFFKIHCGSGQTFKMDLKNTQFLIFMP